MNSNRILLEMVKRNELIDLFLNQIKINDVGFIDVLLQMMEENDLISISCSYETLNCLISEHLDDENTKQCLTKYFDAHFEDIFDGINFNSFPH